MKGLKKGESNGKENDKERNVCEDCRIYEV